MQLVSYVLRRSFYVTVESNTGAGVLWTTTATEGEVLPDERRQLVGGGLDLDFGIMAVDFVKVAKVAEIPAGGIKFAQVNGTPIALCNVEGQIFAVGNVCTHDAGPLSGGTLEEYAIECPRHGARFDVRSGKVLCLPAAVPIPTYEVKVEGEEIRVRVG